MSIMNFTNLLCYRLTRIIVNFLSNQSLWSCCTSYLLIEKKTGIWIFKKLICPCDLLLIWQDIREMWILTWDIDILFMFLMLLKSWSHFLSFDDWSFILEVQDKVNGWNLWLVVWCKWFCFSANWGYLGTLFSYFQLSDFLSIYLLKLSAMNRSIFK